MYDRNFGEEADRVRAMPCLAFYAMARDGAIGGLSDVTCRGDIVPAHVTARAMGGSRGGRFDIVPLCDGHHREAGEARTSQRADFEQRYKLDLRAEADRIALEHPEPLGIRGLASRWAATCLDAAEVAVIEVLRNLNRNGIDAVTPGGCVTRDALVRLEGRGVLRRLQCVKVDGDGWTVEPETWADGWEFAREQPETLDAYETEALMGWVRRRMAREVEHRRRRVCQVHGCTEAPACFGSYEMGPKAYACHTHCGHGCEDGHCVLLEDEEPTLLDREALARAVAEDLGGEFTEDPGGEHGLAWTLCEAAGWPS